MAGQGNTARCKGKALLLIAQLARIRKGTATEKRSMHHDAQQRISKALIRSECQEKQRHGAEKLGLDQKRKGNALHCIQKKEMRRKGKE